MRGRKRLGHTRTHIQAQACCKTNQYLYSFSFFHLRISQFKNTGFSKLISMFRFWRVSNLLWTAVHPEATLEIAICAHFHHRIQTQDPDTNVTLFEDAHWSGQSIKPKAERVNWSADKKNTSTRQRSSEAWRGLWEHTSIVAWTDGSASSIGTRRACLNWDRYLWKTISAINIPSDYCYQCHVKGSFNINTSIGLVDIDNAPASSPTTTTSPLNSPTHSSTATSPVKNKVKVRLWSDQTRYDKSRRIASGITVVQFNM